MRVGFVLFDVISFAAILLAGIPAAPIIVHQDAFTVAGIEVRTSNAKEATNDGVIGKLWQNFFQEGIAQKIPNKLDGDIYTVYSDYASDHNGDYTFLIGAKVPNDSPAPPGLVLRTVVAGDYAVVTSDKGPVPQVVVAAWQQVWSMEDKHELARAYKTDFEVYDQRATDPQNAQVDLYLGLKHK
jgi:predicted transcriptional regulator YdeE